VEILDLRHLSAHDLEPLLQEEIELWSKDLLWDYNASAELIRRFLDSRSLPGYAAMEHGRVAGYSFYVYEEHKGLIGDLFAVRAYRGQVEERLLEHVIETLRGSPGVQRLEAQLMMQSSDRLEAIFRREKFRVHGRKFLHLDLRAAANFPERPTPDYELLTWDDRYFEEVAALIARAYRDHVDGAINDQYRSLNGALRFLRNIIHYPGCGIFHPRGAILALHRPTGRIQGLILTSTVNPGVGHITQVCTAPEPQFRGTGLGYELIRRAIAGFRDQGYRGVSLTVTAANTHAVKLYDRLGFTVLRDFKAYVWDSVWG